MSEPDPPQAPAPSPEPAPTPAPSPEPARGPELTAALRAWLSHPLVLLLVGALLSNLLIPEWNRRTEGHQRELAMKVELSTRINEAVVGMVTSTQAALLGARGQSQEDFDRAYLTWQVRRAVIASELDSYGQGTALPRDWASLADAVDDAYASAGLHDPARRAESYRTWGARRAELDRRRVALLRALLAARLAPFQ